ARRSPRRGRAPSEAPTDGSRDGARVRGHRTAVAARPDRRPASAAVRRLRRNFYAACPPLKTPRARRTGPFIRSRARDQAENEVPHPQDDFAFGFTNVKPPVSPCLT